MIAGRGPTHRHEAMFRLDVSDISTEKLEGDLTEIPRASIADAARQAAQCWQITAPDKPRNLGGAKALHLEKDPISRLIG